jgi:hypothetical protein
VQINAGKNKKAFKNCGGCGHHGLSVAALLDKDIQFQPGAK